MMNRLMLSTALGIVLLFAACKNNSGNKAASKANLDGFLVEATLGNNLEKVVMRNNSGQTMEEGFVQNGLKEGVWITYDQDRGIKSLTSYLNGNLNGVYLEFNRQLHLIAHSNYVNNQLHGTSIKYKFGRPLEVQNYKDGKLDGFFRQYHENTGKMQLEAEYKDGLQDGIMRYFNANEEIIMEYVYKNGQKVSGGATTSKDTIISK
ncbi:MAG: hypothetical protein HC892_05110 [Saprospiraceae bacterium]|nr:hypothetical protein [Saprospiraceae bacterium]